MTISRNDLKKFSSLKRKSKRNELGLFIVEGKKICNELIQSEFEIERLFTTENFAIEFPTAELISSKDAGGDFNAESKEGQSYRATHLSYFGEK